MAAVLLSVAAIGLSVILPGPVGASGPAGSGTIEVAHVHTSGAHAGNTTCEVWAGANITINVTGAGAVAVQGSALLVINHEVETADAALIYVQNTTSSCTSTDWTSYYTVPSSLPTTVSIEVSVPVGNVFNVPAAGEYTFYTMEQAASGSEVYFWAIALEAVFYPT